MAHSRKEDGELEAKQNKELFRTRARLFKERKDKEEQQKQQKEWRAQENKVGSVDRECIDQVCSRPGCQVSSASWRVTRRGPGSPGGSRGSSPC